MIKDFKEHYQEADRGKSVKRTLEMAMDEDFDDVLVFGVKDGEFQTTYSCDNSALLIGYLETAKMSILDGMFY